MSDTRGPEYEDGEETVALPEAAPEPVPDDTTDFFVEAGAEQEAAVAEPARPRARLLPMWILLAAVVLVGVAWAVSDRYFGENGGVESVPLITAEDTPVKVRPADPGGVEVLDRDKYVYKSLTDDEPDAESVLPPPEEPMQRPSAEVSEAEALADPAQSVEPIEPVEESVAEVIEAAPEPVRPEELDVAALEPPEMQQQETEQEMDEAAEPRVETQPAELPEPATPEAEELLDAVAPEPEIVEAEPVPAPEPEPVPAPEPEPVPAPEPEPVPEPEPALEPEPEPEPALEPEAKVAPAATETVTAIVDGPGFMVQVGATQNEAAAGEGLERLAKKHEAILGTLDAVVVRADLGDKGVWYRMRVGPLATRGEADDVCGQLKAVDVGCYVVAN